MTKTSSVHGLLGLRDDLAELEIAASYRERAAEFRAEVRDLRAEGVSTADTLWALERTAADYTELASRIERAHLGLPPLSGTTSGEAPPR